MSERNTEEAKKFSGCMGKMQEMMRRMMSKEGATCCPFAETMAGMMKGCCSAQPKKEGPSKERDNGAPK